MLVTRGLGRGSASQGTLNTFGLGVDGGDIPSAGTSKYHRKKTNLPKKKLKIQIAEDVPQVEQESVFKMQARRIESQIKAIEAKQAAEKQTALAAAEAMSITVPGINNNQVVLAEDEMALLMLLVSLD